MKLLFIISGSIAVLKCVKILNQLSKRKIYINCIMTDSSKKMIDAKKIKKAIKGEIFFNSSEKNNKMLHIRLTRESDLIVVCPATANIIAKFSHGYADDLASTCLIASNKQILFMPAMNVEMWNNKINKKNVKTLQKIGVEFIGPDYGYLSCGEIGLGRLKKEYEIIEIILDHLEKTGKLANKKCLITAGPTLEPIDPIRFISNYSSGIQGYEIAKQLMLGGGKVILVSGPTNLEPPPNVKLVKVKTADEMNKAVLKNKNADIGIFTAAVSDLKPKEFKKNKLKKSRIKNIVVKENPDILKNFVKNSTKKNKIIIGFAAETNEFIDNAKKKLFEKKCDLIVLNKITSKNNVFGSNYNQITLINNTRVKRLKKMTKIDIAKILVNQIANNLILNKE